VLSFVATKDNPGSSAKGKRRFDCHRWVVGPAANAVGAENPFYF
jgi:hypothetical protein